MGRKEVKAEWHTPISIIKNKQEAWRKIDNSGWKGEPLDLTKEITYFDNPLTFKWMPEYDHFFSYTKTFPLYDQRKIRDNRNFLPDIHEKVFQQEKNKAVPVLTSLTYGRPRRVFYDYLERAYNRTREIENCYRKSGIIWVDAKELHH